MIRATLYHHRPEPFVAASTRGSVLSLSSSETRSMDRAILLAILDRFSGGPVRIEALAAAIGEEPETVEYEYEPFLLQQGYISITPKGCMATPLAFSHFGRTGRGQPAHGRLFDG